MKILSSMMLAAAAWGGYQMLSEHQSTQALRAVQASADVNGFVDMPPAAGQDAGTIYVVAAQNCPRPAAQQADQLARQLAAQGIPVKRTNQVSFDPRQVDGAAMQRLSVMLNAPVPLVFVHGRLASMPELNQVVEEFYRPGPTHSAL